MSQVPDIDPSIFDELFCRIGPELLPICSAFLREAEAFFDFVQANHHFLDFSRAAEIAHRHQGGALSLGFSRIGRGFGALADSYRQHQLADQQTISDLRLLLSHLSIEIENRFDHG